MMMVVVGGRWKMMMVIDGGGRWKMMMVMVEEDGR
jgi:hypothetical protein